ncbi:MAG: hypothetical protein C0200_05390 [Thermoproteota archaeon]|nr:MAG: hypothetical protein C0200_05390 [Candidatus Korarchaeota archaeon]
MKRIGVIVGAIAFVLALLAISFLAAYFFSSSESQFVFGSQGRTIRVNLTMNETLRNVVSEAKVNSIAPPVGIPGGKFLYTVTYRGVSYSIFLSGNDTYVVLWDSKGVKGKEKADLVLVKEIKEEKVVHRAEDNSSLIVYGSVGRTYLIKSSLIPKDLQSYNYVHEGEAYLKWYYPVGVWKATNHAKGIWYILYGIAITNAADLSYQESAVGVTCCKSYHYINGVETVASQVRHDTHHMLCVWNIFGVLSRHCDMYVWYVVDLWLNTSPEGHGSDNGSFGCSCP